MPKIVTRAQIDYVLLLRHSEGRSFREVAQITGVARQTVARIVQEHKPPETFVTAEDRAAVDAWAGLSDEQWAGLEFQRDDIWADLLADSGAVLDKLLGNGLDG